MYNEHFGLLRPPFSLTPDTSFFFSSEDSQQALNTLLIATQNGEGFICITGEVGTGKTLLCRKFMASLDSTFVTALVQNPAIQPRSLMLAIADELGIALERYVDQHKLLKALYHRLVDLARDGKRVVVCIDEAQAMPLETMETLRLLTNLETEKRKLMQIVLFGQPELNRKLEENAIRQLAQRITFHYHLLPMPMDEFGAYIEHRLATAGYSGDRPLFKARALRVLHAASGGVPRIAHILAHKALLAAFGQGYYVVGPRHVRLAHRDTLVTLGRRSRWRVVGAFGASLASVGAAAWAFFK